MKTPSKTQPKQERLLSLDALRGFDMLWIVGGDSLVVTLAALTGWPCMQWAAGQMDHVEWHGFHFFDMIFPLFLFIAGVSLPFSFARRKQCGDSMGKIYRHIFTRLFLLILLGAIYNGLLQFDFAHQRYASVLARIGLGWALAAIIMLNTRVRGQVMWFASILLAYWAAMKLIPVPGYSAGVLTQEGSLAGYLDRMLVPGRLYLGNHDPEGIVSTIPAIATALMGVLTGQFLMNPQSKYTPFQKGLFMLAAGLVSLTLGNIWGTVFPVNKNLWTSSFVLVAGGWSLVLLSVFYIVIDVWGFKKWAFPFVVIGLNSITGYMLNSGIISFGHMSKYFFGGFSRLFSAAAEPFVIAAGAVLCMWLVLYILYRKKIFLKV
jgi:predicted acyltransferase